MSKNRENGEKTKSVEGERRMSVREVRGLEQDVTLERGRENLCTRKYKEMSL